MPTEVINLPNLTGYLRFGRDLPVTRFRDHYRHGGKVQAGFVERVAPAVRIVPREEQEPVQQELSLTAPRGSAQSDVPDEPVKADDRGPPLPKAHPGLIGPRVGQQGSSLRQQSRPGKPWRPSNPA